MSDADYNCRFCQKPITFKTRKPFNQDGSAHRCQANSGHQNSKGDEGAPSHTLFAMAAMNAVVSAQIQTGGIDFIHHMNVYDVADISWRLAGAMVNGEKDFRSSLEFPR